MDCPVVPKTFLAYQRDTGYTDAKVNVNCHTDHELLTSTALHRTFQGEMNAIICNNDCCYSKARHFVIESFLHQY